MKRIILLLFLAIFTLSSTQLLELMKLPLLVEHYIEHRDQTKDLSFIAFLEIHYANKVHIDADHEKDMRLPFKSCSHLSFVSVSFCNPLQNFWNEPISYPINENLPLAHYSFSYSSSFLSSIWQPPKSC